MAYNIPEKYQDLTPAPQLDKKTLNKMVWLSCFLQASFNYERMQACGWLWGMLPGLQKIHTNKEDLKTSMAHNLDFLNTHPFLVTFVMGIVLSLEQNKADTQTIRSVRISAAGPLGGIGDALFWLTLVPITAGLTANMALTGSIAGAILFLLIFNAVQFVVRFGLMYWSYGLGTKAVTMLTSSAKEFTRAASILGVFVVGGLIANYGGTTVRMIIGDQLGIPVDFTVSVDLTGFEALVDAIDGVDFEVPINMNYDDPYQDLHIHFNAGMQHLTGEEAMKVVRFRHNNDGSGYGNEDIGRMQTQQAFLKAVAQQTLTLSNLDKIDDFVKIFQQYVETDLTLGNLAWLGKEAISMGAENISFSTLPGEWHSPYIYLDPDATLEVVNQYLNPYVEDRTMEDLNIPA